jgi:acetolactate synthase I/II/III large subunit
LTEAADGNAIAASPNYPAPTPENMATFAKMLAQAQRPIAILGGSGWDEKSVAEFTAFAEKWCLPVAVSFRRQMLFDHTHPNYAGDVGIGINPKLRKRIDDADLIVLIGGRLGEMPSQGYELLDIPRPKQQLIHVHAGAAEIGKVYDVDLGIVSTPVNFTSSLTHIEPPMLRNREAASSAHADYIAWSTPPLKQPGDLNMGEIMNWLEENLEPNTIMTNGAGNYATWLHRFHRFQRYATQAAPTSGSMGYGLPAAVAAALAFPDRQTICFAGDGCFLMHGQEFATAVKHRLPIIVLVINNNMYGTIRMHQERDYPARVSATALTNPDFAALARAYGGYGETVKTTADFSNAFLRAKASGLPSILELQIDPEAITPARTLSQFRTGS